MRIGLIVALSLFVVISSDGKGRASRRFGDVQNIGKRIMPRTDSELFSIDKELTVPA